MLARLGYISRDELQLALGAKMGLEVVSLDELKIAPEVLAKVPAAMAKAFNVVPVSFSDDTLTVAMSNPQDLAILDDLRYSMKCRVQGVVASETAVTRALEKYYG